MSGTGGPRLGHSSRAALDAVLAAARESELTYDHVGSTLHPERFPGRTRQRLEVDVPDPGDGLAAARHGLWTWVPQHHLGAHVHPAGAAVEVGATLLVVLPFGPLEVVAPVRVVEVVEEPDCVGFAYGTLPGHPECGEEAFLAERAEGGGLRLSVLVDARPGTLAAKLAAPVLTVFQHRAARCYLQGLAIHIGR